MTQVLQELAQRADCEMSSKSNSGQSAVHMAAMMGHVRVLHFLLNELTPPMVRRHNAFEVLAIVVTIQDALNSSIA